MIRSHRHLHLACVTLETRAPLSIGGGKPDGVFDIDLARDANGLPTLPGASLAGVLRHLYATQNSEAAVQALFGYVKGNTGCASRLQVGWAHIHDSYNQPVVGLHHPIVDSLLKPLVEEAAPYRDHVRIGHRGAAADRGKFDRSYVPVGMRFSAELRLWSDQANDPEWDTLLRLLQSPLFRVGGATRRGYGKLGLIECCAGSFDLGTPEGLQTFSSLGVGLACRSSLGEYSPSRAAEGENDNPDEPSGASKQPEVITATLKLKPEAGWRFGQGRVSFKAGANGKTPDGLPVSERLVEWKKDAQGNWQGKLGERHLLVPASSVKGALAHRVAYHHNCLTGCYATPDTVKDYDKNLCNPAVRTLFGHATEHNIGDGQAGGVFIDDVYLNPAGFTFQHQMHNSIDRFTGGVRDKVLFSEELVYKNGFELALHIQPHASHDAQTRQALAKALDDIVSGRLPLGAASAKGHGYFTGSVNWSDSGEWIEGKKV